MNDSPPPQAKSVAPTLTAPTVTLHVNPHTNASLSDSEAATMAGWIKADLAAGKLTQAQADQAFAELNTPLEQRGPDTRTPEQVQLDKQFPPANPADYRINWADPGQHPPTMTPDLKQADSNTRTWLAEVQFPRDVGNSLVKAIARVARTTKGMNPQQLEAYGQQQFELLQRAHGPALDEKLQAVDRMVQLVEAKQPGLVRFLKSNGVFDTALIANLLIAQAEVFHARRKGR